MTARWYAVETERHEEAEVALFARRIPVEVFLPRRLVTIRHARKTRSEVRPLLPGYLFARVQPSLFRFLRSIRGVTGMLSFGEDPTPIGDSEMAAFIGLFDPDGLLVEKRLDPLAKFEPGAKVPVVDGPASGLLAEIVRVDGPEKIKVLMQWFGTVVETQVPARFLGEPVSPAVRQASKSAA